MSKYKRNQEEHFRNSGEQLREQLSRRGEDEPYYEEDYRRPYKPTFPVPYTGAPELRRISGFRYEGRENKDFGNYGRGSNQESFNRERRRRNMGFGRTGWPERERLKMPEYRSDEERQRGLTGIHKGKGPRGYQRSDERVRDDINDQLADDSFIDASDIEVDVRNCEVTLTGTVESRDAKRRAEDIGESVSGVKNVENRLRVKRNTDWTSRD